MESIYKGTKDVFLVIGKGFDAIKDQFDAVNDNGTFVYKSPYQGLESSARLP